MVASQVTAARVRGHEDRAREARAVQTAAGRIRAGPKYLFSSLLRCGHCGTSYVIVGRDVYGCSSNVNGGGELCANDAKIQRATLERELLAGIKRKLRSPAVTQASVTPKVADVERIIPGLPALFERLADSLETTLAGGDIAKSRHELRRNVGMVKIETDAQQIRCFSDQGHVAAAQLRVSGPDACVRSD